MEALSLRTAADLGFLDGVERSALTAGTLNPVLAAGRAAWTVLHAGVDAYCLAHGFGGGFEDCLGDVMVVGAVGNEDVEVQFCVGGNGFEEFFDQFGREVADGGAGEIDAEDEGRAPG